MRLRLRSSHALALLLMTAGAVFTACAPNQPPADSAAVGTTPGTSGSRSDGMSGPLPPTRINSSLTDGADVAATITQFHAALARGDSAAALALLTNDVVVVESGGVETRDEYRAHHLPSDIEYARAVPSTRAPLDVKVEGDVAWASGTSVSQGTFRDRAVNSQGAELMVLRRTPQGWRIAAIHWSSRARR